MQVRDDNNLDLSISNEGSKTSAGRHFGGRMGRAADKLGFGDDKERK